MVVLDVARLGFLMGDYRLFNETSQGDHWVFDFSNATLSHAMQFTPMLITKIYYHITVSFLFSANYSSQLTSSNKEWKKAAVLGYCLVFSLGRYSHLKLGSTEIFAWALETRRECVRIITSLKPLRWSPSVHGRGNTRQKTNAQCLIEHNCERLSKVSLNPNCASVHKIQRVTTIYQLANRVPIVNAHNPKLTFICVFPEAF